MRAIYAFSNEELISTFEYEEGTLAQTVDSYEEWEISLPIGSYMIFKESWGYSCYWLSEDAGMLSITYDDLPSLIKVELLLI